MDLSMTLIGVILLAICAVPLTSMYMKKKNKEHKMLNVLNNLASKQNCNLTEHEFCRNFAIGLDQNKHYFFFDQHSSDRDDAQFINLEEIKSCKVVKTMLEGNSVSVIRMVHLVLTSKAKDKEIKFELYNDDSNMQLSEELQIGEKWVKIINTQLKNR